MNDPEVEPSLPQLPEVRLSMLNTCLGPVSFLHYQMIITYSLCIYAIKCLNTHWGKYYFSIISYLFLSTGKLQPEHWLTPEVPEYTDWTKFLFVDYKMALGECGRVRQVHKHKSWLHTTLKYLCNLHTLRKSMSSKTLQNTCFYED